MNKQRRSELQRIIERLADLRADVETVQNAERDAFDNLPDSLQGAARGDAMQEAIDAMDDAATAIDDAIEAATRAQGAQ